MTPFERLTVWLAAAPVGCWRNVKIDGPRGKYTPWYEVWLTNVRYVRYHNTPSDKIVAEGLEGESLDAVLTQALDAMDKVLASRGDGVGPDL